MRLIIFVFFACQSYTSKIILQEFFPLKGQGSRIEEDKWFTNQAFK